MRHRDIYIHGDLHDSIKLLIFRICFSICLGLYIKFEKNKNKEKNNTESTFGKKNGKNAHCCVTLARRVGIRKDEIPIDPEYALHMSRGRNSKTLAKLAWLIESGSASSPIDVQGILIVHEPTIHLQFYFYNRHVERCHVDPWQFL